MDAVTHSRIELPENRRKSRRLLITSNMATHSLLCSLLLVLGSDVTAAGKTQELVDYCLHESFNATCPRDHVIVMMAAIYGRMRSGRCITNDYGQVGCSTDVLGIFDEKCSGRSKCLVAVRELVDIRPCQKDFINYLEAAYQCVRLPGKRGSCHEIHEQTESNATGYLGLVSMTSPSFGTKACPWQLKVAKGQRLNITFLDLGMKRYIKEGYLSPDCSTSLAVQERGDKLWTIEVCRGRSRAQHIYTSTGNYVKIYIERLPAAADGVFRSDFLLQYSAVGCPDLVPLPDTWIQRNGDNLVVKCNHSQETWYLTCQMTSWIGEIGNCSRGLSVSGTDLNQFQHGGFPPHGIVLAIVVGILLGIAIGSTMLLSVHCIRRRRRMKLQKERENTMLMVSKDGASEERVTSVYPHALCVHSPKLVDRDPDSTYPALLRDVEVGLERSKDCLGDYCTHHYCHHAATLTPAHNLYHPDSNLHHDVIQTLSRLEPCGPGLLDLVNPAEQVDIMPLQTFRRAGDPKETPTKGQDVRSGVRDFQLYGRAPPLKIQTPGAAKRPNPESDPGDGQPANAREQDQNRENSRNTSHGGQLITERMERKQERVMK